MGRKKKDQEIRSSRAKGVAFQQRSGDNHQKSVYFDPQMFDDDDDSLSNEDELFSKVEEQKMAKLLHAYKQTLQIKQEERQPANILKEQQYSPTHKEILDIYTHLESQAQSNTDQIITQLYNCLILKTAQGKDAEYIERPINRNLAADLLAHQAQLARLGENKGSIIKRYIRNPDDRQYFHSLEDELKFNEKKLVAKAFCSRDYGIGAVQEEIQQSGSKIAIERGRYKTLASTVVTDAYRKLQSFLLKECKRKIKQLNREQIRSIFTILLNCRKNFQQQDCSTFFKFMKIAYGIGSVTITEQSALNLYISIQKSLRAKMAEMQLDRMYDTMRCNKQFRARRSFQNERFQLHKIWTTELEQELLETYKKDQTLVKIRDFFKLKYSQNQHLFTIDSLRSRLHKILRVALRKVGCFCQKFGQERVPSLIKLNDLKVKFILRSPDALTARLLLVDMYLNDQCDIKRLYQTVSAVNEFIIMKDTERMGQIIEAEPLIQSASEKVHHNVTISRKGHPKKHKDQVFLKQTERNFDHFVQIQNGHSLHYFKMSQASSKGEQNDIKMQEGLHSQSQKKQQNPSLISSISMQSLIKQQLQRYRHELSHQDNDDFPQ